MSISVMMVIALVAGANVTLTAGHSCYYFVVVVSDCHPAPQGSSATCLACAAEHHSQLIAEGCTDALINASCHGVKPPEPPHPKV